MRPVPTTTQSQPVKDFRYLTFAQVPSRGPAISKLPSPYCAAASATIWKPRRTNHFLQHKADVVLAAYGTHGPVNPLQETPDTTYVCLINAQLYVFYHAGRSMQVSIYIFYHAGRLMQVSVVHVFRGVPTCTCTYCIPSNSPPSVCTSAISRLLSPPDLVKNLNPFRCDGRWLAVIMTAPSYR